MGKRTTIDDDDDSSDETHSHDDGNNDSAMVEFPDSFSTPDGKGLGGATCCPEFESLVANSLTSLDVISLREEPGLDAVQNFVVDEMQSSNMSQLDPILPSAIDLPPGWKVFDTQIKCKKPHAKKRASATDCHCTSV